MSDPTEPTEEPQVPEVPPQIVHHDATGTDLAAMIAHAARGKKPTAKRPRKKREQPGVQLSGSHADGRDPRPLSQAFARLTAERGWNTEINIHLLLGRWGELVGDANAAHSAPESFENGVLTVRCDSTAWASNLRMMASILVARLNDELGQGAVTRVVTKGPDAPSWKHGTRVVRDGRGPRDTYG